MPNEPSLFICLMKKKINERVNINITGLWNIDIIGLHMGDPELTLLPNSAKSQALAELSWF